MENLMLIIVPDTDTGNITNYNKYGCSKYCT